MRRYLNAIDRELEQVVCSAGAKLDLNTLYVGGGTPTHFPPSMLVHFLQILNRWINLDLDAEVSMEANPEDISDEKLAILKEFGCNRMSLGVQSFDKAKLDILQRAHTGSLARERVLQTAALIENVSIDLIFAVPSESIDQWSSDLLEATRLPVQHVSTYALTFEKGTPFWSQRRRGQLCQAEEGEELAMYDLARRILPESGLDHYEVSNFAAAQDRCRHNLAYWAGDGWYAIGPGAARFVDGVRSVNHRSTTTYLKRIESGVSPIEQSEQISVEQAVREAAAFGVRQLDGICLLSLSERFRIESTTLLAGAIEKLIDLRLVTLSEDRLKLTDRGIHFADTVASELLG